MNDPENAALAETELSTESLLQRFAEKIPRVGGGGTSNERFRKWGLGGDRAQHISFIQISYPT